MDVVFQSFYQDSRLKTNEIRILSEEEKQSGITDTNSRFCGRLQRMELDSPNGYLKH